MLPSVTRRFVALFAANAAPAARFGVFAVQNDTGNVVVGYQIKIGDGPWVNYTLRPGENRTFWHEYKNQFDRSSPPTLVRFNSAVGNNPPFTIQYSVQRYAAPDRLDQYAKKYSFRNNGDNYFDLSSIN